MGIIKGLIKGHKTEVINYGNEQCSLNILNGTSMEILLSELRSNRPLGIFSVDKATSKSLDS